MGTLGWTLDKISSGRCLKRSPSTVGAIVVKADSPRERGGTVTGGGNGHMGGERSWGGGNGHGGGSGHGA